MTATLTREQLLADLRDRLEHLDDEQLRALHLVTTREDTAWTPSEQEVERLNARAERALEAYQKNGTTNQEQFLKQLAQGLRA